MTKKKSTPDTPFSDKTEDGLHRDGDKLWIPLEGEWRNVKHKPEEVVRQKLIRHLNKALGGLRETAKLDFANALFSPGI
ncbi:MAG: hypothetical protein HZC24_08580 [Rhodocyclales bacterium]|nr:hypothetical protein [Rhodocyclales bacterium]